MTVTAGMALARRGLAVFPRRRVEQGAEDRARLRHFAGSAEAGLTMNLMRMPQITVRLPADVRRGLEASGRAHDRTLGAELRRAARIYLENSEAGPQMTGSAQARGGARDEFKTTR